jgi:hypothetical protein
MKLARMLLGVLALAWPLCAQVPTPGQGTTATRERPAPRPPSFDFHSNFWVNLHHFLYQQARLRGQAAAANAPAPATPASTGAAPVAMPAPAGMVAQGLLPLEALSEEERRAWSAALDYYAEALAKRDLLFDGDMVNINNRLAEWEKQPDLSQSGLRAPLVEAMNKAAPVYRTHWWPEHDRANRAWIAAMEPRVRQMGAALTLRLAAAYQAQWPAALIWVDVSHYAGRVGAYTSDDPLHVTISSADPRNAGESGFEILFHEASHGLTRHVEEAIARECRARNKPIPRDLWHAVLFYTTGEVVRRMFAEQAAKEGSHAAGGYTPYAYREGLYARAWPRFQPLLETHWQAYLDGKIDFDRAIARIVNAL